MNLLGKFWVCKKNSKKLERAKFITHVEKHNDKDTSEVKKVEKAGAKDIQNDHWEEEG